MYRPSPKELNTELVMKGAFLYSFFQQGIATSRPEDELERLTKKLVYDMNHPPVEDYFGTVATLYINN